MAPETDSGIERMPDVRAKARGHRDVVTVVGHAATIAAGEWITASGEWINHRTNGQQLKARFLRTSPPTSADGIGKYLSSHFGEIINLGATPLRPAWSQSGDRPPAVARAQPLRAYRPVEMIGSWTTRAGRSPHREPARREGSVSTGARPEPNPIDS